MYGNHPRILAVSLFSQCVDIEQNARGTQMTTRVTEGARQDRRVSRLFSCISCARVLPSLNRKEKRDCSQPLIIRNQGNFCFWNRPGVLSFGIPNLGLIKIRNSGINNSTDRESWFQYLESEIHSVESSPVLSIHDCLGSPYSMGRYGLCN